MEQLKKELENYRKNIGGVKHIPYLYREYQMAIAKLEEEIKQKESQAEPEMVSPPKHSLETIQTPSEEKSVTRKRAKKGDTRISSSVATDIIAKYSKQVDKVWYLYKAGFSNKQIADYLGTSANTVAVDISRQKKKRTDA